MNETCAGCADPLDDEDETTPDGTRHVECVCKCHTLGCNRSCDDPDCDLDVTVDPCKGQCGCSHCRRSYQDFLSME